jgi:hypothetical protein
MRQADSLLNDTEAAAALEDALGPEPWQLQDPATVATIQRHIREAAERLLEKLYADYPIEETHVVSTADIDRYEGDISVRCWIRCSVRRSSHALTLCFV